MLNKNSHFRFLVWVAWRNLASRKAMSGLSVMTRISILGVAIGVAALIIVLSIMGGFEQDLKSKMLRGQPHLEILADNAVAGFSLKEHPLNQFHALFPQATGLEPYTQADIVLSRGKSMSSAVMFGVSPEKKGHLWGFGEAVTEGNLDDIAKLHSPLITRGEGQAPRYAGIALGADLAGQLGANLGDEIVVITPQVGQSSSAFVSGGTFSRSYILVAVFATGLFNFDSKWAVVTLGEGRKFMPDYDASLDEQEYVTGVAVNMENPYDIEDAAAKVASIKGLKPHTWKETNAALLFALKLEKFTMGAILTLIVLVAAFSISGTMMMTVFHKKTQVCLLRAIGMTKADIAKVFLMQGFAIGTIGILFGLLGGVLVCAVVYVLQAWHLNTNVYFLRMLPVKFLPRDYVVICFLAWVLTLLGATYPSLMASRQDPSRGLRF